MKLLVANPSFDLRKVSISTTVCERSKRNPQRLLKGKILRSLSERLKVKAITKKSLHKQYGGLFDLSSLKRETYAA
jgi:hypothetical protein